MNLIHGWVKESFILIMSIAFLELLLPQGSMHKYVKFIFSLMILAVLLTPIVTLMDKFD